MFLSRIALSCTSICKELVSKVSGIDDAWQGGTVQPVQQQPVHILPRLVATISTRLFTASKLIRR